MNCCLGDICEKIGSGATPRGGKESYCESGTSLIRSQNVLDWEFNSGGLAHIDDIQANRLESVSVHEGDLLFNITGESVARTCIVSSAALPARTNQHVCILRVKPGIADPQYVLALLEAMKTTLLQIASSGATRQALTKHELEQLPISLPSLLEQEKHARIIEQISELIRVKKQANDYLAV